MIDPYAWFSIRTSAIWGWAPARDDRLRESDRGAEARGGAQRPPSTHPEAFGDELGARAEPHVAKPSSTRRKTDRLNLGPDGVLVRVGGMTVPRTRCDL